ncbi:hypothetical protein HDU88_003070 [Geranomyces variabilis]|nr:hypothetical protein HDU88_003070 [Geranomyces variabilis]
MTISAPPLPDAAMSQLARHACDPSVASGSPDSHDWRYEMRRDMQQILPGVWLGPHHLSRDKEAMKAKGITHMLCIRDPNEAQWVRCLHPNDFVYHLIEVTESPLQNLIPYFPQCRAIIDSCLGQGGSIFVHCSSAISRSPCFVVSYVMSSQNWPFQKAYSWVQNRRFCINPSEGFKHQLKEYEPIWQANEDQTLRMYDDVQILQQGRLKRTMHGDPDEG